MTTNTFFPDSRISYEMYSDTWKLENGKFIIIVSSQYITDEKNIYDHSFLDNDNKLILKNEEGVVSIFNKI